MSETKKITRTSFCVLSTTADEKYGGGAATVRFYELYFSKVVSRYTRSTRLVGVRGGTRKTHRTEYIIIIIIITPEKIRE